MLDILLNAVLPVFVVIAVGFAMGRWRVFDRATATTLNRFVFYVPIPALMIGLLSDAPLASFEIDMLLAYLLSELLVYALGFAIARYGFRREFRESLLLGMAAAFVNHVFFVLPVAVNLFGESAATPIVAIISVDAVLIYGGTVMLLESLGGGGPWAGLLRVARTFRSNPQIMAIVVGLGINVLGLRLGAGIDLFLTFVGNAAAPTSLFALGLILSAQRSESDPLLAWLVTGIKLLLHPLLAWALIVGVFEVAPDWSNPALMVAAGPCGAMAFVLALQYHVAVDSIARAVLYSSVGALLTVSVFAGL